ncbi:MAG: hypothetical protein Q4F28_10880 [Eubacteriales bacterium]|nr:hypothetical protein [Eubacteriales bacterium]
MRAGTGILKFLIIVALVLTIIQKVTGSADTISVFLGNIQSVVYAAMPVLIVLGGIYILIRSLFK